MLKEIQENTLYRILKTAIDAGLAILEIYRRDFSVEYKDDRSPLTDADRASHEVIDSRLRDFGIPVLSEEGVKADPEARKKWTQCWIVDPLDGTKEFIKRNGEFTVNIALVENGAPVFGVIYVPVTDTLYYGIIGEGAYIIADAHAEFSQGISFDALKVKLPSQQFPSLTTIVGSRSHASPETEAFIEKVKAEKGEIDFAASGSSLKFCLLAEGRAHIYPRFAPTMEWDTAAGQAILEAAGGKVIRHDSGQALRYNKENLLNPWFIGYAPGAV